LISESIHFGGLRNTEGSESQDLLSRPADAPG
jgi:hypothetical protein